MVDRSPTNEAEKYLDQGAPRGPRWTPSPRSTWPRGSAAPYFSRFSRTRRTSAKLVRLLLACRVVSDIHSPPTWGTSSFNRTPHAARADQVNNRCPPAVVEDAFAPELVCSQFFASDGIRTRDIQVNSLSLYPLSYFNRCGFWNPFAEHEAKTATAEDLEPSEPHRSNACLKAGTQ